MVNVSVLGQGDLASYIVKELDESDIANLQKIITHESVEEEWIQRQKRSILQIKSINNKRSKKKIKEIESDVIFCVGWYEIIDEDILNEPPCGIIGIHASPLPKGRGGAPVNWQIIYDKSDVTLSAFRFTERVDDGPILSQKSVPIETRDDIQSLYNKVIIKSRDIITNIVSDIHNNEVDFIEQSEEEATYWPQRVPEDGIIDWDLTASFLSRFILAQTDPYPGAYTFLDRKKVTIKDVERENIGAKQKRRQSESGEITDIISGKGIEIMTGNKPVLITKLSYDDGPNQWADRWAEQQDVEIGQKIGRAEDFPVDFIYTGLRGEGGRKDYHLTTNVQNNATVENYAIIYSPHREREITVNVLRDKEEIIAKTVYVKGWTSIPISFTSTSSANSYIQVKFSEEDSKLDERNFYVYKSG